MPPVAPPTSLNQPTATYTIVTASNPSVVSAKSSVASAFGRPSGFPTNISLDQRDGSTHNFTSTGIESPQKNDSITIEPSKYPKTASGSELTAVPKQDAELECMKAWSRHHPRPPCTEAEEEQARIDGENFMLVASVFGAVLLAGAGVGGAYIGREKMRASQMDEERPLFREKKD